MFIIETIERQKQADYKTDLQTAYNEMLKWFRGIK